ncbi:MAG: hypothetical protein J1E38_07985 [Paramuribaculum sp.]|nr:hypothetical protein [Paramuribaculum sp.]
MRRRTCPPQPSARRSCATSHHTPSSIHPAESAGFLNNTRVLATTSPMPGNCQTNNVSAGFLNSRRPFLAIPDRPGTGPHVSNPVRYRVRGCQPTNKKSAVGTSLHPRHPHPQAKMAEPSLL